MSSTGWLREPAGDVDEQAQRRVVGAVDVLQNDHERPPAGRACQRLGDALEPSETLGFRICAGGCLEEWPSVELLENLQPWPVGGRSVELRCAALEHSGTGGGRLPDERRQQPRLADAGLAAHDDDASVCRAHIVVPIRKRFELAVAAYEHAVHEASIATANEYTG